MVVDTNVFVSGVFFGGVPGRILRAWREARIELVVSLDILEEYRRVGETLRVKYQDVDLDPFLALLATQARVVDAPTLAEPVSVDPDDDKFLACALAGDATIHRIWRQGPGRELRLARRAGAAAPPIQR